MNFPVSRRLFTVSPGRAALDKTRIIQTNVPPLGLPRGYNNPDYNASLRGLGIRQDRRRPT